MTVLVVALLVVLALVALLWPRERAVAQNRPALTPFEEWERAHAELGEGHPLEVQAWARLTTFDVERRGKGGTE